MPSGASSGCESIVGRESDRLQDSHQRHKAFVMQNGEDMPEVRDWKWKA